MLPRLTEQEVLLQSLVSGSGDLISLFSSFTTFISELHNIHRLMNYDMFLKIGAGYKQYSLFAITNVVIH